MPFLNLALLLLFNFPFLAILHLTLHRLKSPYRDMVVGLSTMRHIVVPALELNQ